jgi:uncharacterized membrane protein YgcG
MVSIGTEQHTASREFRQPRASGGGGMLQNEPLPFRASIDLNIYRGYQSFRKQPLTPVSMWPFKKRPEKKQLSSDLSSIPLWYAAGHSSSSTPADADACPHDSNPHSTHCDHSSSSDSGSSGGDSGGGGGDGGGGGSGGD